MKKLLLGSVLLLTGVFAHANDCVVKDKSGTTYDINLQGDAVDVVTAGAGWLLHLDRQLSTETTKYYSYKNLIFVFVGEKNTVSIYDYDTKNYYFQNQACRLQTASVGLQQRKCTVKDIKQFGDLIEFMVDGKGTPIRYYDIARNNAEEILKPDPRQANTYLGRDHGDFQTLVKVDPRTGIFTILATEAHGGSRCL